MAHFGDFLIYAAAACALLSLITYFLAWRDREQYLSLARNFFRLSAVMVVAALGTLMYLILSHDFSVAYVFSYSSTDLPLYYLIATLWGGQEGTFLLWLFYTCLLGLVMMKTARGFEKGNMFFLNLFVLSLLFIMIKKSPFELSPVFREEGAGLNPLLQNFWMTIHPPIMFIGFAAALFPFCFAMTALVERQFHTWGEAARRWTMFAWATLGVSLVMGGYWAYETLGWGGFWAWDPVENSSLIPWLFLTTQVHALFIKRQRRGLMRFSLFAVCLTFWSVLYGTFLTRSGVLADFSVHSFVDLGINQFLVGGMGFFVLLGTFFLVLRWREIKPEPSYSRVNSRSYLVTLGVVILFLGGVLVLIGTSAPLLTRVLEKPSNVGIPYYFSTMTPIAVAILLLTALFPSFRWNEGVSRPKLLTVGLAAGLVTVAILLITGFTYQLMYLLLFGTAAWSLVSNGFVFVNSLRNGNIQPGYLSHVGLALLIIGAAVANGFETKMTLNLPQNEEVSAMGSTLKFTRIEQTPKGYDCHVEVTRPGESFLAVLPHEFPKNQDGVMRKPYVENYLAYDLYLSPVSLTEEKTDDGSLYLTKGGSTTIDKYEVTFHKFEISNHGESAMSAAAVLTVRYDGKTEEIKPFLKVSQDNVSPEAVVFDSGRAGLAIAGVRPEDGGVVLRMTGAFMPTPTAQAASLVMEFSKKPLILLFWLGTLIAALGGLLSMIKRKRGQRQAADALPVDEALPASDTRPIAASEVV